MNIIRLKTLVTVLKGLDADALSDINEAAAVSVQASMIPNYLTMFETVLNYYSDYPIPEPIENCYQAVFNAMIHDYAHARAYAINLLFTAIKSGDDFTVEHITKTKHFDHDLKVINSVDNEGYTPLMCAAAIGNTGMMEDLWAAGAPLEFETTNSSGEKQTAHSVAYKFDQIGVEDWLLNKALCGDKTFDFSVSSISSIETAAAAEPTLSIIDELKATVATIRERIAVYESEYKTLMYHMTTNGLLNGEWDGNIRDSLKELSSLRLKIEEQKGCLIATLEEILRVAGKELADAMNARQGVGEERATLRDVLDPALQSYEGRDLDDTTFFGSLVEADADAIYKEKLLMARLNTCMAAFSAAAKNLQDEKSQVALPKVPDATHTRRWVVLKEAGPITATVDVGNKRGAPRTGR